MGDAVQVQNDTQPPRYWGRLLKRILLWIVAAIFVLMAIIWIAAKRNDWRQFHADLTTYRGVTIGQTKTDVQYALGAPQTVQGPETLAENGWKISSPLLVNPNEKNDDVPKGYDAIPANNSATDYNQWHFWNHEGTFDVDFNGKTGRVESVTCTCWQESVRPMPCVPLFGVGQDTDEGEVRRLLGKPDKEEVSGGETFMGMPMQVSKTMDYNALGLHLVLAKRQVTTLTKRAPQGAGWPWWLAHRLF